ncbi:cupin domain-containing protein [Lichenifustis flavocetrariae]|uniref:Cupin domain-containing protein n=1 Tax=Lichenifustis flavocetrariae TaxID=2949735 RepID=A0AA41YZL3_9HYPH|nr:cupin domain-containing protein [Lichenifustis flavocetrariae]MCW6511481.1 cupin domain-containing protein [Lichenifustis flavocetrariae]
MEVLNHAERPLEQWREGVMTQMRMSYLLGGRQLCIFDQFCDPGLGAPTHIHAAEEVLEVISGSAEVWLNGEHSAVTANQSVLIPAGATHGFRNTGTDTLHVRATLAASIFEAQYESSKETSRRWSPSTTSVG